MRRRGWFLLRDQIQETLTLLLLPAWIVSEWYERTGPYEGQTIYLARILAVLAIVYLTAFRKRKKPAVFGILFGVGGVMLAVSVGLLEGGWANYSFNTQWGFIPLSYRVGALGLMLVLAACGAWLKFDSLVPAAVVAAVAFALPWSQRSITEQFGTQAYTHYVPSLLFYLLLGGTSIFLVGWGVRSKDKPMVNYGTAAFAVSVLLFYFSSVMDKLNRSLGLILLGVLFLAGGWALEVTRRRLVSHMNAEEAR